MIVGSGGIGGIVTAALLEHGASEVCALTTNQEIARAVSERGFRVCGVDGARTVRGACRTKLSGEDPPFDFVMLAVQPPQVEGAVRDTLPWLAPDGAMVCLQNGLCEERVEKIVGPDRVLGAVVSWGAAMPEPGLYERTAHGGFTLGRLDGRQDPRLPTLRMLLEVVGPTEITPNLLGARWSKLAINCAISTLGTIGGDRLGALMMHLSVRRLALRIMAETVRVARKLEVRLEKVSGTLDLEWMALTDEELASPASPALVTRHAMLLAVGARYRRMRSSMLSAIERGRTPAVDYLNGEVVTRGRAVGVPTEVNAAAQAAVHAIAEGRARCGMPAIYALAEEVGAR